MAVPTLIWITSETMWLHMVSHLTVTHIVNNVYIGHCRYITSDDLDDNGRAFGDGSYLSIANLNIWIAL